MTKRLAYPKQVCHISKRLFPGLHMVYIDICVILEPFLERIHLRIEHAL